MKALAYLRNGMLLILLLVMLSAFLVQCAPIGQPFDRQSRTFVNKVDDKTTTDDNQKQEPPKKDEPFFTGTHKFDDLKTYEIPKEILPFVPEHLQPPAPNKTRLIIHNPVLEVDMDKSKMTVTLEVEVPGEKKEKLVLEGEFSKTDPMWNADLFPVDEAVANERRVQGLVACLDAHYCKNIAVRIYYKHKNEILEEQVESNKIIVSELELKEENEEQKGGVGHSHTHPGQQQSPQPQQPAAPQTVPQEEPQQQEQAPTEKPRDNNSALPAEEQSPSQNTDESSSPKAPVERKDTLVQPVEDVDPEQQSPNELDYLTKVKRAWNKIAPEPLKVDINDLNKPQTDEKPVVKPKEEKPKVESKAEPKKEETKKDGVTPPKVDPKTDLSQLNKPQTQEKPVEKPMAKPPTPPKTMEQLAKRENNLVITMPMPLPAPKVDDKRSIPGLKDKVFIPGDNEACTRMSKASCQSHGSHNSGFLTSATEFPNNLKTVLRRTDSRRGNYHVGWGNKIAVDAVIKASEDLNKKYPSSSPLYVTQISKQAGGSDVSKSHRHGLDVDILWPGNALGSKDGPSPAQYAQTFDLIKSLVCAERSHVRLFFVHQDIKVNICQYAKKNFPEQVKDPNSCEYRALYALVDQFYNAAFKFQKDSGHIDHLHMRSSCPRYNGCSADSVNKECIHAFCVDAFVVPNKGHNIGC